MLAAQMDDSGSSRRRRGAGIVTPNACTECRKKRAKCDGQTPCRRCVNQNAECVYEIPVRQSKENMRAEIEQLQQQRRHCERLLAALSSNHMVDETVRRLRNGQTLEMVSDWLEHAAPGTNVRITTYESPFHESAFRGTLMMAESVSTNVGEGIWPTNPDTSSLNPPSAVSGHGDQAMDWASPTPDSLHDRRISRPLIQDYSPRPSSPNEESHIVSARGMGQDRLLGPVYRHQQRGSNERMTSWTTITSNKPFIDHLLALYFCWEYPTFASLSKEHFMSDFRDGRPRYCSSLLVNAMLALGCRFSTLPETRGDPNRPETAGDHFFAEAKRLLAEDDHKSLTTIQALGLFSIREASAGRDTESFFYSGQAIRLATEFGLHMEVTHAERGMEHEVRAATFWGAFALDQATNLCIGRLPHLSRAVNLVEKPAIVDEIESSEWVAYSDRGAPTTKAATQPSNVRSVFKCFAELSQLVHQSLYTLHTPGKTLTSNEVLSVYFRYLNWYSSLPEALRLGRNFTPAVLFVHMYYHFAILMLFRAFIKLRFIGSSVMPRTVCAQSADAILTLLRSYDQLYTLQRTPSFVPYIVLSCTIIHLVVCKPNEVDGSKQVIQGVADLKAMVTCHGFAKRGLDILRFLAVHWKIGADMGDNGSSNDEASLSCAPSTWSSNMFCPNIESVPDLGPSSGLSLFNPFPMQGTPFLSADEDLERDGFAKETLE